MIMVIIVYLFFIIKAVTTERVTKCGRLLPKNSVFPIYFELYRTLLMGNKKWPMFAKIG